MILAWLATLPWTLLGRKPDDQLSELQPFRVRLGTREILDSDPSCNASRLHFK